MSIFQTLMNLFNDTRDVINRENTGWDSAATGILRSVQHDINSELQIQLMGWLYGTEKSVVTSNVILWGN